MKNSQNVYKLYASFPSDEAIEIVSKKRFARITPNYILVYTNKRKPKNFIEIKDSECDRLTKQDKEWLFDCNIVIISEYREDADGTFFSKMTDAIIGIEKALEAEAKSIEIGGEAVG